MRYRPTVYAQLLKALPRHEVERAAKRHACGRAKRVLSPWAHLVSMVLARLAGARSLRDLERLLERRPGSIAHLGLTAVRRATLADANAGRSAALFGDVARALIARLGRGRLKGEAVRLLDAIRLYAGKPVARWANHAVKLHLALDLGSECPVRFPITSERVNDITPASRRMPIEPGATGACPRLDRGVFGKGYYSFPFWAALHEAGCRFVTWLKKNSPIRVEARRPLASLLHPPEPPPNPPPQPQFAFGCAHVAA